MDNTHSVVREAMNKNMKRQDKKRKCQIGGRLAKQAPRTPSRLRQESVYNNQNREETNPKQTRSSADDAACRKPAIGKHVVDVSDDRNVRDVLKLSSAKTSVNIGTWNVRSLLGSGKSDLLVKELQRLKWDVVGLAELRWKNQGVLDLDDGCKIIFAGASISKDKQELDSC